MIILPGNAITVKTASLDSVLKFTRSVLWGGAEGDTTNVTIGFAEVLETATGSTSPLFHYDFNLPIGSGIAVANHDPTIVSITITGSSVDAEILPGQDNKPGRITVSSPGMEPATISGIQSVSAASVPTRVAVSLVAASFADTITDALLTPALNWSGNVEYYTPANNFFGTPSETCWAEGVDLRCVAMDSSRGGAFGQGGGTLVTARHILAAKHYPFAIGQTITFTGGQTRTITGVATSDGDSIACDIQICTLSAAITPPIVPVKIPGAWFDTYITADPYLNRSGEIQGYGALGFAIHQNGRKIYPILIQASGASSLPVTVNGVNYASYNRIANFRSFNARTSPVWWTGGVVPDAITGDSGGPVMYYDGISAVLLSIFTSPWSGPSLAGAQPLLDALIASADAAAGISTGLTVTVAPDPTLP